MPEPTETTKALTPIEESYQDPFVFVVAKAGQGRTPTFIDSMRTGQNVRTFKDDRPDKIEDGIWIKFHDIKNPFEDSGEYHYSVSKYDDGRLNRNSGLGILLDHFNQVGIKEHKGIDIDVRTDLKAMKGSDNLCFITALVDVSFDIDGLIVKSTRRLPIALLDNWTDKKVLQENFEVELYVSKKAKDKPKDTGGATSSAPATSDGTLTKIKAFLPKKGESFDIPALAKALVEATEYDLVQAVTAESLGTMVKQGVLIRTSAEDAEVPTFMVA